MNFRNLRVLVVLPMYGGSLPIGRYCALAFRELACSVRVFDPTEIRTAFMGIRNLDLSEAGISALTQHMYRLVNQAVWTMVQEQKPQLVFAVAQAPLDRNLLKRISGAGIRTAMWFVEDYRVFGYWQSLAPAYDVFAIIQKQPFINLLARVGQKHAFYLPLSALPDFHKPVDLLADDRNRYGSALSFLGAGYPNRRAAFAPLTKYDFKIWGNDWDEEKVLADHIQEGGRRVSEEEGVKIYNASGVNLNLHSSLSPYPIISGGDFVNPRTFELAACGAFQIVDNRTLLRELFTEDELPAVATGEEFYKAVDHYLGHPEERASLAQKARARVLAEHTYQQRMKTLLEYMAANFGLEPPAKDAGAAGLPPEVEEKLKRMKERLNLSDDCSFEDVIGALRRESGELDDTGIAMLFLDEWRRNGK